MVTARALVVKVKDKIIKEVDIFFYWMDHFFV
jgi:hypothetical protein